MTKSGKEAVAIKPLPETTVGREPLVSGTNIVFIAGGSGAGKNETINKLLALGQTQWWRSISYTTRFPRPGEEDGVHYHFRDERRFRELVDANAFVECARVHGHWYGTPLEPMLAAIDAGSIVIGDIDVQGVAQMRTRFPMAAFVFLYVERAELEARLRRRGDVTEEDMQLRLAASAEEFSCAKDTLEPGSLIRSTTVIENGLPTLKGIDLAAQEVSRRICEFGTRNWTPTIALHTLCKRIRYLG